MPPVFPQADRRELIQPPLELVVCQLRFPPVLALVADNPPGEFQNRLRESYPAASVSQGRGAEIDTRTPSVRFRSSSVWWSFEDKDSLWTVSLAQDFLSLETKRYRSFDEFLERFQKVLGIARELYPIELRQRLGLRYVDRIAQDKCRFLPADWPSKIRQDIIPLRTIRGDSDSQLGNFEARFAFGDRFLAVRCSFVDEGYSSAPFSQLVLDFDCYTEKRGELAGLEEMLREFKAICYNAFRWSIGELIEFFEVAGRQ